jgi:hypothetical protein
VKEARPDVCIYNYKFMSRRDRRIRQSSMRSNSMEYLWNEGSTCLHRPAIPRLDFFNSRIVYHLDPPPLHALGD